MKPFIRLTAILMVFNLVIPSCSMAENTLEKDTAEMQKELKTAQKNIQAEAEAAQRQAREAQREAERAMKETARQAERTTREERQRQYILRLSDSPYNSGEGKVLVIPAAEIEMQDLATIMEDMSVMSRILDKKLDLSPAGFLGGGGGLRGGYYGQWFFSQDSCATKGIYLDGYGALFLMKMDFRLSPPAETQEKEEIEDDIDPVWEQTKQEIYAPKDAKWRRRKSDSSAEKYDAEKVEELKRNLIKTLKHAANIRNLKPDQWVIRPSLAETAKVRRSLKVKQSLQSLWSSKAIKPYRQRHRSRYLRPAWNYPHPLC